MARLGRRQCAAHVACHSGAAVARNPMEPRLALQPIVSFRHGDWLRGHGHGPSDEALGLSPTRHRQPQLHPRHLRRTERRLPDDQLRLGQHDQHLQQHEHHNPEKRRCHADVPLRRCSRHELWSVVNGRQRRHQLGHCSGTQELFRIFPGNGVAFTVVIQHRRLDCHAEG